MNTRPVRAIKSGIKAFLTIIAMILSVVSPNGWPTVKLWTIVDPTRNP